MKVKIFIMSVVIIVATIVSYGSLAYQKTSVETKNIITSGNISIAIIQTDSDNQISDISKFGKVSIGENIMPSQTINNCVSIKNIGNNPAFVKVKIDTTLQKENSQQNESGSTFLNFAFNNDYWTQKDGYFYYKEVLQPNQTSQPLYKSINLDEKVTIDYKKSNVDISILAKAIQSENNSSDVFKALENL